MRWVSKCSTTSSTCLVAGPRRGRCSLDRFANQQRHTVPPESPSTRFTGKPVEWFRAFGVRLRATRSALGIDEAEAARAFQMSLRAYRRRESGLPFRGGHYGLYLFAKKYDLSLSWLIEGAGPCTGSRQPMINWLRPASLSRDLQHLGWSNGAGQVCACGNCSDKGTTFRLLRGDRRTGDHRMWTNCGIHATLTCSIALLSGLRGVQPGFSGAIAAPTQNGLRNVGPTCAFDWSCFGSFLRRYLGRDGHANARCRHHGQRNRNSGFRVLLRGFRGKWPDQF